MVNFAQGAVLLVGAYLIGRLQDSRLLARRAGGVAAAAFVSLPSTRPVRPVRDETRALAILTLGVDILLTTEMAREIGTDVIGVGAPWGADVVELAGTACPASRVIAGGVALVRRPRWRRR